MTKQTAKKTAKKTAPKAHPKTELQRIKHLEACKKRENRRIEREVRAAIKEARAATEMARAKCNTWETKLAKEIQKAGRNAWAKRCLLLRGEGWKIEVQLIEGNTPCGLSVSVDASRGKAQAIGLLREAVEVLACKPIGN